MGASSSDAVLKQKFPFPPPAAPYKSCRYLKEWSCLPWGPVLFLPMLWQHNPGLSCQGERRWCRVSWIRKFSLKQSPPGMSCITLGVYLLQMECAVGSQWASHTPVLAACESYLRLLCSLFAWYASPSCGERRWKGEGLWRYVVAWSHCNFFLMGEEYRGSDSVTAER